MWKHHGKIIVPAVCCLAVLFVGCGRRAPVQQEIQVPVVSSHGEQSMGEIEAAIIRGAVRKQWMITKRSPGEVQATLNVRGKHTVEVAIPYTASEFSIKYVSSSGLKYEDGKIHRNANKWIEALRQSINKELR